MKAHVLLSLIMLVFWLSTSALGKDVWTQVRTKNFLLVGNASEKDISAVALKLEQFRATFKQIFPHANVTSVKPTIVIVFKNNQDYKPFKPVRADGQIDNFVEGYFQPGLDVNYITLSIENNADKTFGIIFHEYVHFIINNNFGRASVPPWFNEGLAEYYQTFRLEDDQRAVLGELQTKHLQLLQRQELISFDQFFNTNYFTLHNQGNHGRSIFYAEAWALLHYLQESNKGARREQLTQFLNLLLQNKPAAEAFQTAFQTDFATMEKELKKYVSQRNFNSTIATLENKLQVNATIELAQLSEADANAYLGDLLLHTNRLEDAQAQLGQALALDKNSALAHASLAMALAQQGKFDEAKPHFEKAVSLDSKNYLPYFYYAYALSKEDMDANGYVQQYLPDKAAKMTNLLDKAIKLNPTFPESYRLRAFVNIVNNYDLNEGVELLNKALLLEPGNQNCQLDLAQIHFRQQDFDEARKMANKVFFSAEEVAVRTRAQALVANINRYEAELKRLQEIEKEPDAPRPAPTPQLSEEELINQSLNEALRRPRKNEKRTVGYLTEVSCENQATGFSVRTGDQPAPLIYKFVTADLSKLTLVAFTAEANAQLLGCDTKNVERFAVVTFRPNNNFEIKNDGEIIALEFMPQTFKMIQ